MLKVTNYTPKFTSNHPNEEQTYSDPLTKWPVRGLAYSNELGAAISEVAPKLGTLLWFPAMLYFGADIYDKYKNEQTSYSPDKKRGTQQTIFQLLASVILPTGAVIAGQKIASALGTLGKTGLSLQTQEGITRFLQDFASRRHIDKYSSNIDEFKTKFEEALMTKREKLIRENSIKRPIAYLKDELFNPKQAIALSQKDKVMKYANEHIDTMFDIYKTLEDNKQPKEFSKKLWKKFNDLKIKYAKDPDYEATYFRDAAEDAIKKYQKSRIMNAKILKTAGGFAALGLAIKPIDNFVEHIIIKKVVEPKLNKSQETITA